jgi:hypothetical protein
MVPWTKLTLVIGPDMLGLWPEGPATDESGLGPLIEAFDLNGAMLWETPEAKVNCSRSSTLVRPLADWAEKWEKWKQVSQANKKQS